MNKTFEDYIYDRHAAQYSGIDDDMPDDYGDWVNDLDPNEVIEWAQKWHDSIIKKENE